MRCYTLVLNGTEYAIPAGMSLFQASPVCQEG